jgi:LPXTG-motif cell wall-anchored protein
MAGNNAPEIDGNTASAAVALVSGGLLVLRGRRKK